ncbi:MAG: hypothetical protein DME18_13345 [Verrucomicrobia bacterium]|nr:MAG: hypothetical protein DME18_13345 [Verrucomicrobiota bacterium]
MNLICWLHIAAAAQLAIALLNLFLVRLLGWKSDLERAPLLLREVFHVHAWFISITLTIFAVLTWRFADEFAAGANPASRWLAAGVGMFWGIRAALQVVYYSASHWRGRPGRRAIHVALLATYAGFAAIYFWSVCRESSGL